MLACLLAALAGRAHAQEIHLEGRHASGAFWAMDVADLATWNGVLLLYARGYGSGQLATPTTAPRDTRDWLLMHGYALAASSYSRPGWALAEAPGDQLAVLDEFIARFGSPRRVIAWGDSMGGLVTLAIAERHGERIDGAISMCGSTGGSLGMLNTALDGAFAFKVLAAPDADIALVRTGDDRANAEAARAALAKAMETPEGRARVALSAVLGQIPHWTDPQALEPRSDDHEAQLEEMAKAFVSGVFLPRADQELRAGGVYSWNTGVDFHRQLDRSGRRPWVEAFYRKAGLNLNQDLKTLNRAPRIEASPAAIAYMRANYVPTGRLRAPVMTLHELGDGLTLPNMSREYADRVGLAGRGGWLAQAFVRKAGHCRFSPQERLSVLQSLEDRLEGGRWTASAFDMNTRSTQLGGEASFVHSNPAKLLRSCGPRPGSCPGEPQARR